MSHIEFTPQGIQKYVHENHSLLQQKTWFNTNKEKHMSFFIGRHKLKYAIAVSQEIPHAKMFTA